MGKLSLRKGARFEREVAKAFETERVGLRGKADREHADVAHEIYFIQCKSYKRLGIYRWFKEVRDGARRVGKKPMLVVKQDRERPLVVMELEDFTKLMRGTEEKA